MKDLYLTHHIGRLCLRHLTNGFRCLYNDLPILGTMTRRQFMRGTDPIKSTWVYPKLIL